MTQRRVFTTGQVAKICKVAPRTVAKWFDAGKLRGYTLPGSGDRRVPREHLLRFCKEIGFTIADTELDDSIRMLVVGSDAATLATFREVLSLEKGFRIELAASGFEAGVRSETFSPACVVIDFDLGRAEAAGIVHSLRTNGNHPDLILVALIRDKVSEDAYRSGFNEVIAKPIVGPRFAERVRFLVAQREARLP